MSIVGGNQSQIESLENYPARGNNTIEPQQTSQKFPLSLTIAPSKGICKAVEPAQKQWEVELNVY